MDIIIAVISWVVFGLIIGAIARLLVPGRQAIGIGMTIVLGIVGSLLGGFLAHMITGGDEPYGIWNWVFSILGAVILLFVFMAATRGRRRTV